MFYFLFSVVGQQRILNLSAFGGIQSQEGAFFFIIIFADCGELGRTDVIRQPRSPREVAGRREAPLMVDSQISIKTTKRQK